MENTSCRVSSSYGRVRRVGHAAGDVHHRLAVDVDAEPRADLAVLFEVLSRSVAHRFEAGATVPRISVIGPPGVLIASPSVGQWRLVRDPVAQSGVVPLLTVKAAS